MHFHKRVAHYLREIRGHGDAFPGQLDGRLEKLGPGQLPVEFMNSLIAPQLSRNTDPLAACKVHKRNVQLRDSKVKKNDTKKVSVH